MVHLKLEANVRALTRWGRKVVEDQMPFATAVALTDTAFSSADAVRARLPQVFKLRKRSLANRGRASAIHAIPAEKRDWPNTHAAVQSARWAKFLSKHETGGTQRARDVGAREFAIPTRAIKRTAGGRIPKPKYSKRLLQKKGATITPKGQLFVKATKRSPLTLFYHVRPTIRTKPVLHFERTVTRTAVRVFDSHFRRRLVRALKTRRR